LHWVIGNEPISLAQLKERYYEPGLLSKVMGFNKEALREVRAFAAPKLFPEVKVEEIQDGKLRIHLKNRGGGIGRVVIRINGKERTADARGLKPDENAEELTIEEDLSGDPRIIAGVKNRVEVFAYNQEGYLRSRGFGVAFKERGTRPDPRLWAIVAGVSDYRGERLDLRFAAKDAGDIHGALKVASTKLFGAEHTHVKLLKDATRPQLLAELTALSKSATSSDILVLYLAGHGVTRDDEFYYLTSEAERESPSTDPEVLKHRGISSRELTRAIRKIPALKQVLILDTCASGGVIKSLTEVRAVSSSQVRALERVKDRMGMFVLAGCASDQVSFEASRFGQGLLTYSLLLGMKGGALRDGEFVDVGTLFGFAADSVPRLATDIGGVQRPVVAVPRGSGSFDLGQLDEAGRRDVPLRSPLPVFVRSSFQDRDEADDVRSLSKHVDDLLNEEAHRGRDAALAFFSVTRFPDAYRIAGDYVTQGSKLAIRFKVRRGKLASEFIELEGEAADPAALARKIVAEAQAVAKTLPK
jgi:hypothetical protein